jgi:hydroxymethylpyrimidine/phosphomethylpyrimidine kinase
MDDGFILELHAPRIDTKNTHGTGCTLSASIAAGLAKGFTLDDAVRLAHHYLQGAIGAADDMDIGSGHGPVHHFHQTWT